MYTCICVCGGILYFTDSFRTFVIAFAIKRCVQLTTTFHFDLPKYATRQSQVAVRSHLSFIKITKIKASSKV